MASKTLAKASRCNFIAHSALHCRVMMMLAGASESAASSSISMWESMKAVISGGVFNGILLRIDFNCCFALARAALKRATSSLTRCGEMQYSLISRSSCCRRYAWPMAIPFETLIPLSTSPITPQDLGKIRINQGFLNSDFLAKTPVYQILKPGNGILLIRPICHNLNTTAISGCQHHDPHDTFTVDPLGAARHLNVACKL